MEIVRLKKNYGRVTSQAHAHVTSGWSSSVPWRVLLLQTRNIQDDLKKFSTANMILVD